MIDLKPYGAFIQNTVKPLVEEAKELCDKLEKQGLPVNRDNLKFILDYIACQYKEQISMQFITAIVLTLIICATCIVILR